MLFSEKRNLQRVWQRRLLWLTILAARLKAARGTSKQGAAEAGKERSTKAAPQPALGGLGADEFSAQAWKSVPLAARRGHGQHAGGSRQAEDGGHAQHRRGWKKGGCEEPALLVLGGRRCEHTGVLCGGCEHREPHLREACGGWKRGR